MVYMVCGSSYIDRGRWPRLQAFEGLGTRLWGGGERERQKSTDILFMVLYTVAGNFDTYREISGGIRNGCLVRGS